MTITVTHSTVATLPDEVGAEINKAEWNANHTITGLVSVVDGGTGAATAQAASQNLAVPYIVGKSGVSVSGAADTNENILATITLPALTANAAIRLFYLSTFTNNANVKTIRVRLGGIGGTIVFSTSVASQSTDSALVYIANRNATNSQVTNSPGAGQTGLGLTNSTVATSSIDLSTSKTIVITVQKATAGDTMTLESYLAELITDGT